MTVVFLNVTGSLGGAERVLITLLHELRRLKPQWRLLTITGESGPLLDVLWASGFQAEILPMPDALRTLGDWGVTGKAQLLWRMLRVLPGVAQYRLALKRKLAALTPAIVHTNGFKIHVLGALASPRTSRLVWHVHDFVSNRAAMKTLLRWQSKKPAAIAAVSEAVAADVRSLLPRHEQVHTIWNAIDLDRFSPSPLPESEEVNIGFVATFARWKGHAVFLNALALLPSGLRWRALIAGEPVYARSASQVSTAELQQLSSELGLANRVRFTGFAADPAPLYATLDIVVHASTEPEPFGLVIAEGMACGRAVVTSSNGLVADRVDGLIHQRGNAADLAGALEELICDRALRQRLGTAARATAELRFAPQRMAREFIALYKAVA